MLLPMGIAKKFTRVKTQNSLIYMDPCPKGIGASVTSCLHPKPHVAEEKAYFVSTLRGRK